METLPRKTAATYEHGKNPHPVTDKCTHGKVTTVPGVRGSHHILGIEHLLSELWNGDSTILLASTGGQGGVTSHEEVKTWEGNHIDGQLPQIGVELTRETQTGGDTGHDDRHEVVKVAVCRGRQLESTEADIVQSLVINTERLVRVFNELVN